MFNVTSTPQPAEPQVIKPNNAPAFKGEDDSQIAKAIEKNNDTAKTCAAAALITSFATLLPLSVLAYKTHNISKVAEAFQKDAKPFLENAGKITKNMEGVTGDLKTVTADIKKKVSESLDLMKTEEFKGLLDELKTKVHDIDGQALTNELQESIKKITDAAENKLGEVDPEAISKLIGKVEQQIEGLNLSGLSENARSVIQALQEKIASIKFSIG